MENVVTDILTKHALLDTVPFSAAIIDSEYKIVAANKYFEQDFGKWRGAFCYEVCRREKVPCSHCRLQSVLREHSAYSTKDSLNSRDCGITQYAVHFSYLSSYGRDYAMALYFKETEEGIWQREYNTLFDRSPSIISILDREFNLVRVNERFRSCFGEMRGKKCFEAYKRKGAECLGCPAVETFEDGIERTATLSVNNLRGEKSQFIVSTLPIAYDEKGVSLVMEIGTDITEIMKLQEQLRNSQDFCTTILNNSSDAIIALDKKGKALIFNDSIQRLLGWVQPRRPGINQITEIMPKEFFGEPDEVGLIAHNLKTLLTAPSGEKIPVTLSAYELRYKKTTMGRVAFINDVREQIEFEKKKIETERQARSRIFGSLNERINLMLGTISDDIYSLGEVLTNEDKDCHKLAASFNQLKSNYENTLEVVNIYMKYAGDSRPSYTLIDMESLVYNLVNRLGDWLKDKNIHVITEIRTPIEQIYFNLEAFEDFFKILVSNAISLAPWNAKSPICLKWRVFQRGDEVVMEIFELPYEAEASMELDAHLLRKDIRFGLATAELIAADHGATLECSSNRDWGKLFRLRVSRKKSEEFAKYFNRNRD